MTIPISSRALSLLTLVLALGPAAHAQETLQSALRAKLEIQLTNVAEHLNGVMGYAIKDLSTGETFLCLPDSVFPQASSIKLTVLLELMRQAQEGKLSLEEKHTLQRDDRRRHGTHPYYAGRRHGHHDPARSCYFHGGPERQYSNKYPRRPFRNG